MTIQPSSTSVPILVDDLRLSSPSLPLLLTVVLVPAFVIDGNRSRFYFVDAGILRPRP